MTKAFDNLKASVDADTALTAQLVTALGNTTGTADPAIQAIADQMTTNNTAMQTALAAVAPPPAPAPAAAAKS